MRRLRPCDRAGTPTQAAGLAEHAARLLPPARRLSSVKPLAPIKLCLVLRRACGNYCTRITVEPIIHRVLARTSNGTHHLDAACLKGGGGWCLVDGPHGRNGRRSDEVVQRDVPDPFTRLRSSQRPNPSPCCTGCVLPLGNHLFSHSTLPKPYI